MTTIIKRHGLIFTKGGLATGIRIDISLPIEQLEDSPNWFILPKDLIILSGKIRVKGKVKVVGRQVYFDQLDVPNVHLISSSVKNLFEVENFEGCFPGFTFAVRRGSELQMRLELARTTPPVSTVINRPEFHVIRFQL